jgi:hypothetical protein
MIRNSKNLLSSVQAEFSTPKIPGVLSCKLEEDFEARLSLRVQTISLA